MVAIYNLRVQKASESSRKEEKMPTAALSKSPERSPASTKIGWALSGLAILFLGTDAVAKIVVPAMMAAYTPPQLRLPADPAFYRLLGGILALSTALYALPRTAVLGAVLLTGYLGGAIATHLIAGSPLFSNTLFGAYLGLAVWGGLYLREPRLRSFLPLRD
jgi:hypothetical protein